MARARNIKPKFFQNDELGEVPPLARLLFIGLWTIADYRGCLEFRPKRVKAQILPYDECDIEELANYLDKSGFISIYSVRGQLYVKVLKFEQHQTPHKNERDAGSDIPDMSEKDSEINELNELRINPDKNGTTRAESLFLNPESGILNPEASAPRVAVSEKPKASKSKPAAWSDDFEMIWPLYPKKPGMSKADALKAFSARVNEGASVPAMRAGVEAYALYVLAEGTEPKYIKAPETFFGPGKHWESDWSVSVRAVPTSRAAPVNEKFNFSHLDRSGDQRAMAESMARHGITVDDDEMEHDL